MTAFEESCRDHWADLRKGRARDPHTPLRDLITWAQGIDSPVVKVAAGANRDRLYRRLANGLSQPWVAEHTKWYWPPDHLYEFCKKLRFPSGTRSLADHGTHFFMLPVPPGNWELLWGLVLLTNLTVTSPLLELVDQVNTPYAEFHQTLTQLRLDIKEDKRRTPASSLPWNNSSQVPSFRFSSSQLRGFQQLIECLCQAKSEHIGPLLFFLSLVWQQGLLDAPVVLVFDNVDRGGTLLERPNPSGSEGLASLIKLVEAWDERDVPVRILLGGDSESTVSSSFRCSLLHSGEAASSARTGP